MFSTTLVAVMVAALALVVGRPLLREAANVTAPIAAADR